MARREETTPPSPDRALTDESLRAERERADRALTEELAGLDETADAVIVKARERADDLLATARAKTDQKSKAPARTVQSAAATSGDRAREDATLKKERAQADETVRVERAEHVAQLSIEREETDRDLLSERVRADDALATRDEFLGVVSHDLRNMLTSIMTFASLIAKDVTSGDPANRILVHAQRIQRSTDRMNRLIGDLIDVASIEAGLLAVTREVGDPAQVVTEAMEAFQARASANGISLVADIGSSLVAEFDAARILQVLINLLSNAIKFTPANGKIVVRVERIGDELRFAVTDTGTGIPSDKLDAVFERFLQINKNDRRGVGLGLFISKCIVQGHGGRIWAESKTGQGSAFYFTLPIHLPG